MSYFTKHLKEAKVAAGDDTKVTFKSYWTHLKYAFKEFLFLQSAAIASLIHALFPWWYGFDLIQRQVDMLKRINKQVPHLKIWDKINLK